MNDYFPPQIASWLDKVDEQPYSDSLTRQEILDITAKKKMAVYGWTLADYLVTRASIIVGLASTLKGLEHVVNQNHISAPHLALGAASAFVVYASSSLRDFAIHDTLQSIDEKIIVPPEKHNYD